MELGYLLPIRELLVFGDRQKGEMVLKQLGIMPIPI